MVTLLGISKEGLWSWIRSQIAPLPSTFFGNKFPEVVCSNGGLLAKLLISLHLKFSLIRQWEHYHHHIANTIYCTNVHHWFLLHGSHYYLNELGFITTSVLQMRLPGHRSQITCQGHAANRTSQFEPKTFKIHTPNTCASLPAFAVGTHSSGHSAQC